ncbi:MAG: ABC transporter ATP-binding protein [Gammaproteobacteria bacterium]|jgi:putative ABC transport system ATP-binding protein|nr:ABC transporter ATP-binding protein [Gammaproteobacteria bacterium]MBT3725855.1 ABC transporter ATP-binding protein [Gammaproteobacteria bacterium]MBT4078309.1 ABC transporter ATP-binding protein [Gammaproteobacteria bacterium]MBT4193318.1 ABC transporter ATP-binding protein [Gammaproteobacteria bacterium]MBT4449227.1 ABC transporter ATP-binding protein [Gammaproteobacteria bacterium]
MISLTDVHVKFGINTPLETHALRGINLNIKEGEFVTVIGSNGAGKSSLLNALSGEIVITSGKVEIANKDVTKLDTSRRAGMVARVFQDPLGGSCEFLSIEENLALADVRGHKRGFKSALNESRKQPYRDYLSRLNLGLEHRLGDKMGLLSGGQRQAISLLMATLQPSNILLLDEHTAALDPKTSQFVLDLTCQIIEEKKQTALMVTHSMKQALDVGTRTIMLHQGKVIFDIEGEERKGLTVKDLLDLFSRTQGEQLSDDALLLG